MCFKVVIVKKKFAAGRLSKRFILEKLSKLPFTLLNYLSDSRKGLFWKNFQATFTLLNYLSASPNSSKRYILEKLSSYPSLHFVKLFISLTKPPPPSVILQIVEFLELLPQLNYVFP